MQHNENARFIVMDKDKSWTSHDVVAKMRGLLKEKKIGHLGTLDPIATGVLVLAVGRDATKQVANLIKLDKEYEVEMELGKTSDTYDAEGKIELVDFDLTKINESQLKITMARFWGETMQIPPAFSAKKINGKKAYELARAGKPVNLEPKKVKMQGMLTSFDLPFVKFTVSVSSGTYVRTLVHDIGQVLGCGAIMTNLRRTRVGHFKIEDAKKIEDFQKIIQDSRNAVNNTPYTEKDLTQTQ